MKIVAFELEPWEKSAFEQLAEQHDLVLESEPLRNDNAERFSDAEVISTFIYSRLGADVLRQFERLRMIATRSTGIDHIDRGECGRRNIAVSNVPVYGDNTVAEHVFGLLLTISHRIWDAVDRTRKGDFTLSELRGFDLQGKTLGVIGTGAIGRHVIQIAKGFGMTVVAHDMREDREFAERLGFEYESLENVFKQADVLTLHVPASPKTENLVGDDAFAQMKDGVVLINTARGCVVDIKALVRALGQGKVAAVGLDVLPEEPTIREEAELLRSMFRKEHDLETLLANHLLLRLRNVYITPHSAFNTREAVKRILDTTVENIMAFERGQPQSLALGSKSQEAPGS